MHYLFHPDIDKNPFNPQSKSDFYKYSFRFNIRKHLYILLHSIKLIYSQYIIL